MIIAGIDGYFAHAGTKDALGSIVSPIVNRCPGEFVRGIIESYFWGKINFDVLLIAMTFLPKTPHSLNFEKRGNFYNISGGLLQAGNSHIVKSGYNFNLHMGFTYISSFKRLHQAKAYALQLEELVDIAGRLDSLTISPEAKAKALEILNSNIAVDAQEQNRVIDIINKRHKFEKPQICRVLGASGMLPHTVFLAVNDEKGFYPKFAAFRSSLKYRAYWQPKSAAPREEFGAIFPKEGYETHPLQAALLLDRIIETCAHYANLLVKGSFEGI